MKRMFFLTSLLALALGAWAQDEDPARIYKPDPEIRLDNAESQIERLNSRVSTLEGRIRISGYLAYSALFDLDKFQVGSYDETPENSRFRFNFDFSSRDFGLRARLQYRYTNSATALSAHLAGGPIDLEYFSAFANLWMGALRVTGGRTRIQGDYNLFFYGLNDHDGPGAYNSGRSVEGFEYQVRPIQVLQNLQLVTKLPVDVGLGLFLPWRFAPEFITGPDLAWRNTGDRVDLNAFVLVPELNTRLSFGWLMGNAMNESWLGMTSFGNYYGIGENSTFDSVYVNLAILRNFFELVPNFDLGLQWILTYRQDNLSVRDNAVNGTLRYLFKIDDNNELTLGLDVLTRVFHFSYTLPNNTQPRATWDDHAFSVNGTLSWLSRRLAFGYDLRPSLQVRYETAKDASPMTAPAQKLRLYPAVRLLQGRNEWRLGYISDFSWSKYDGVELDIDGAITTGITINY